MCPNLTKSFGDWAADAAIVAAKNALAIFSLFFASSSI
jgi:hypothetical protein